MATRKGVERRGRFHVEHHRLVVPNLSLASFELRFDTSDKRTTLPLLEGHRNHSLQPRTGALAPARICVVQ